MSDLYSELLVKKERTAKRQAGKRQYHCTDRASGTRRTVYYAPASDRGNCTGSLCLSFLFFQELIWNLSTCL